MYSDIIVTIKTLSKWGLITKNYFITELKQRLRTCFCLHFERSSENSSCRRKINVIKAKYLNIFPNDDGHFYVAKGHWSYKPTKLTDCFMSVIFNVIWLYFSADQLQSMSVVRPSAFYQPRTKPTPISLWPNFKWCRLPFWFKTSTEYRHNKAWFEQS